MILGVALGDLDTAPLWRLALILPMNAETPAVGVVTAGRSGQG